KHPLDRYNELTEDVSHEVGHQWFYGTVGSDEYMEPWLDEGLTNLLENGVYDLTYTKSKSYCAKLMHSKFYTRKNVKRANKILKENANQFINKNQKANYINYPVNNPPKGVDTEDMAYKLGMDFPRSEEHTSELQSRFDLVCRLLLEKKKTTQQSKPPDIKTSACSTVPSG